MENLEHWYVQLNPGAYVPTLLVHPNNTPVCESAKICKYIENNFNGTCSLLSPIGCDEERGNAVKARFEQLYEVLKIWELEAFTAGAQRRKNILLA